MKKKLFNIIGGFILIFSIGLTAFSSMAYAKEITIVGADNPIVTTESGEDVTNKDDLNYWQSYNVTYHWSILNGQSIQNGDTATFTVPSNIKVIYPTNFEVKDQDGHVIGTFTVNPGDTVGTLTFNNYFAECPEQDIHGTLTFIGNGTDEISSKDWTLNKVGWLNGNNQPTWSVAYNPSGQTLHDVTIEDTLLGNQTLDPTSISIQYGYFDANNQFHSEGTFSNSEYQLETGSKGFTLHFDTLTKPIQITYHSTVPSASETVINNNVQANSPDIGAISNNASIAVGGDGSASGTIPTKPSSSTEITQPSTSISSTTTQPSSSSSTSMSSTTTQPSTSSSTSMSSTTTQPSTSSSTSTSSTTTQPGSSSSTSISSTATQPNSSSSTSTSSTATQPSSSSSTSTSSTVAKKINSHTSLNRSSQMPTSEKHGETTQTIQKGNTIQNNNEHQNILNEQSKLTPDHEYYTENGNIIRIHNGYVQQKMSNGNWKTINDQPSKNLQLPQTGIKKYDIFPIIGLALIIIAGMSCVFLRKNEH